MDVVEYRTNHSEGQGLNSVTDIELCKKVDQRIERYYIRALRYGRSIPDYALIQYRKAAECACDVVIEHFNQPFSEKNSLWKKINFLFEKSYIDIELRDQLDSIRENANNGAHHVKDDDGEFDNKSLIYHRINETRENLIACLVHVVQIVSKLRIRDVSLTTSSVQKGSDIILEAVTSIDWNTHYRMGLYYEALISDDIIIQGKRTNNEKKNVELLKSYFRSAANSYQTAFRLSYQGEGDGLTDFSDVLEENPIAVRISDYQLDPLFKYAHIVLSSDVLHDQIPKAMYLLELAARNGHGKSAGLLGNCLYEDGQYHQAQLFLLQAAESLDDDGLCGLFFYYSEGKALAKDLVKALGYLRQGVELGSVQCLGVLGSAYYNGIGVVTDRKKGLQLARKAMQQGSLQAYHFVKEAELNAMQDFYLSTQKEYEQGPSSASKPVGRNDMCPCGSGKKYKKCCLPLGL